MRFTTIVAIAVVTGLLYTGWGSTTVQNWLSTRGLPNSERRPAQVQATPGAEPRLSSGAWRSKFRKINEKLEQFQGCRDAMPAECRGQVPSECRVLLYKPDGVRVGLLWNKDWPAACDPLEDALLDSEDAWRDEYRRVDFEATRAGIPQEWRH